MNEVLILLDGDILCYTASASVETAIDWGDDWWTLHADFREAKQKIDADIVDFVEQLGGTDFKICLSCQDGNFRKKICPSYKDNRKGNRKPVCYKALRQYMIDTWQPEIWKNIEADDVMGILSTSSKVPAVIVSVDKDMKTIPGRYFNPSHPDMGVIEIDEAQANRQHLIQTLTGDRTDGYPGCPGIGPARAEKIVDGGWNAVVESFVKAGLNENVALEQARMSYILRKGDYCRKSAKVKLWTPAMKA
jgi:DNA polymerase-1